VNPLVTAPTTPAGALRRYYNQATPWFVRLGGIQPTWTIHRAVWAEGAASLPQALNYTNRLVLHAVQHLIERDELRQVRLADLGCGVGGSLFFLARHLKLPYQALGLTISGVQARTAATQARRFGLHDQCAFLEADYLNLPLAGPLDVAFSIEALAHAPDPARYMQQVAQVLRPGARLLLCDDFRVERPLHSYEQRWLAAFQRGWHAPALASPPQLAALAEPYGLTLVSDRDLTPDLRLLRLPTPLAQLLVHGGGRLGFSHPLWQSFVEGGIALQECLRANVVTYRWLEFERQ
jgi:SAM-dependent methyltransferase